MNDVEQGNDDTIENDDEKKTEMRMMKTLRMMIRSRMGWVDDKDNEQS